MVGTALMPKVVVSSAEGPDLLQHAFDFEVAPRAGEVLILKAQDGQRHSYRVVECFHLDNGEARVRFNLWVAWEGPVGWWAAGENPPVRARLLNMIARDEAEPAPD
jgi:hypothetical protein